MSPTSTMMPKQIHEVQRPILFVFPTKNFTMLIEIMLYVLHAPHGLGPLIHCHKGNASRRQDGNFIFVFPEVLVFTGDLAAEQWSLAHHVKALHREIYIQSFRGKKVSKNKKITEQY